MAEPHRSGSDRPDLTERILVAARLLMFRVGARRMSLTEVATLAGVSRPTLYRYFQSKEDLVEALGKREYRRFNSLMHEAVSGLTGRQRLEAAIDVVAGVLEEQPPRHLIGLEPGFVNDEMAQVLPMMMDALVGVLSPGTADARDLAGAIARTALSHYIFPDADAHTARRQIRVAAGLPAS